MSPLAAYAWSMLFVLAALGVNGLVVWLRGDGSFAPGGIIGIVGALIIFMLCL